jgi:hypothetical protein
VTGTWSSTTTQSAITDANKNDNNITVVPNKGVNKFTWTLERDGNTYAACKLSETVTFDNKFVKAEVPTTVFESCDNTVELTAIKVWDKYSGAEGWWSTNDATAYFSKDAEDNLVQVAPHGSSSAENNNVVTAYGITAKGGTTFTWKVRNGDPTDNTKACSDFVNVTVLNNGLPAEVVSKQILLCSSDKGSTYLHAKALNMSDAYGQWT